MKCYTDCSIRYLLIRCKKNDCAAATTSMIGDCDRFFFNWAKKWGCSDIYHKKKRKKEDNIIFNRRDKEHPKWIRNQRNR